VDALQNGRSFAARAIRVHQEGRVIAQATISLRAPEKGSLEHQLPRPPSSTVEQATPVDLSMIPFEARAVGGVDLASRAVGPAESAYFMRTPRLSLDAAGALHAGGALDAVGTHAAGGAHRAMLAFATPLTLIGTTLRPHAGLSEADSPERLATAVTTHTIWLHDDDLRVDDWWLLAQSSPLLAGARGFGRGDVFDGAGRLMASFAQESLIRVVEPAVEPVVG
jgi:acyl-CoA thioesterase-2